MRLFIGTPVPTLLAQMVHDRCAMHDRGTAWRFAPLAQWHVTALFVGERPDEVRSMIEEAVERIAGAHAPILLTQGRLMSMPKRAPSMLWVRFSPNAGLTSLHMALARATGTSPSAYRPYWPHITLARSRQGDAPVVDGGVVLESMAMEALTLFRSTPTPEGSVHTPLASWPLTGTDRVAPEEVA